MSSDDVHKNVPLSKVSVGRLLIDKGVLPVSSISENLCRYFILGRSGPWSAHTGALFRFSVRDPLTPPTIRPVVGMGDGTITVSHKDDASGLRPLEPLYGGPTSSVVGEGRRVRGTSDGSDGVPTFERRLLDHTLIMRGWGRNCRNNETEDRRPPLD